MNTVRSRALIALTAAGLLWGTSVPLSKAALAGFGPAWLTVLRFALAGAVILLVVRPKLRGSVPPALVAWGALGYGACIALQNFGLGRTSVTHAALLIGATPVIVAVLAVLFERATVRPLAWAGFGLSLAGIALVAGTGGGDASLLGDALVLASVLAGSAFTLVQARMLPGTDVVAVTAAQFLASAALVTPVAVLLEGAPWHGATAGGRGISTSALAAMLTLVIIGTVLPYTLFAFGQTGVEAQVAGVFLNLETLVATTLGVTLFGEAVGAVQVLGALGLLAGIYLSTSGSGESASQPEVEPAELPTQVEPEPLVRLRPLYLVRTNPADSDLAQLAGSELAQLVDRSRVAAGSHPQVRRVA